MSSKKGQITIFIIVGVIIVMGFLLIRSLDTAKDIESFAETPLELQPIKNYIDDCLKITSRNGLELIGKQGGYYKLEDNYAFVLFADKLPYYYIDNEIEVPSINFIQSEISNYVDDYIDVCLDNLRNFRQGGFEFSLGNKQVNTIITNDDVVIDLDYPINIKRKDELSKISSFSVSLPSRLKESLSISNGILDWYSQNPGYICLSCLKEMEIDKDALDVSIVPLFDELESEEKNNVLMVHIVDKGSQQNRNYTFRFILDYPIEKETLTYNKVELENIGYLEAEIGYEFSYQVKATGEDITFLDNTNLFDISSTGMISFTPIIDQIGNNIVEITATDSKGNYDSNVFIFSISSFLSPLRIDYIGYLTTKVGERFVYNVTTNRDDDIIYFQSDNDLFGISLMTGVIDFIPSQSQIGDYILNITAVDSTGAVDIKKMNLRVIS